MLEYRLDAYQRFLELSDPSWAGSPELLDDIDFDDIHYYVKATEEGAADWDDVPEYIKDTFDKLGIPEAERQFLAGAGRSTTQRSCTTTSAKTWSSRASSSSAWTRVWPSTRTWCASTSARSCHPATTATPR